MTNRKNLLKTVLLIDGVVTGANALAYLMLPHFIQEHLGYPTGLQLGSGLFLAVFTLFVLYAATRPQISTGSVKWIIEINAIWPVLSLVALIAGWLDATTLGAVWAIAQALVVGGFAMAQAWALKQSPKA